MHSEDETCYLFALEGLGHSEAVEGQDPVAAPFRYDIGGTHGDKTHCLRPKGGDGQDMTNVPHRVLGQVFQGKYNLVVNNLRASVVWEAPCLWFTITITTLA